jgi:hypothetical protein
MTETGQEGAASLRDDDSTIDRLAHAHAREAEAWLRGYDPGDGNGAIGDDAADEMLQVTRDVVIAAYCAGREEAWSKAILRGDDVVLTAQVLANRAAMTGTISPADAERALRSVKGMAWMIRNSVALLAEAAALFRSYEAHHRAKATAGPKGASAFDTAERNAEIAGRIEAFMTEFETPRDRVHALAQSLIQEMERQGGAQAFDFDHGLDGSSTYTCLRDLLGQKERAGNSIPFPQTLGVPDLARMMGFSESVIISGIDGIAGEYALVGKIGENDRPAAVMAPEPTRGGLFPGDKGYTTVKPTTRTVFDRDCTERLKTDGDWDLRDLAAYLTSGTFHAGIENLASKRRWADRIDELSQLLDDCRPVVDFVNTLASGAIVWGPERFDAAESLAGLSIYKIKNAAQGALGDMGYNPRTYTEAQFDAAVAAALIKAFPDGQPSGIISDAARDIVRSVAEALGLERAA